LRRNIEGLELGMAQTDMIATGEHPAFIVAVRCAKLAIISATFGVYLCATADATLAQTAAAPPPPPVTVSTPLVREIIEWDEFTGRFAAVDYVEIRPRVSGYLTEIHFRDGDMVKKDDLLIVIDPRPFEIARDTAQAQIAQAQAKLDLANVQLQRTAELRKSDFAPQATLDERRADLRSAQAALDSGRATLRSAELDLEFTHVTSPITGRVSLHMLSIGNLVNGGTNGTPTLLTTVVSIDPVYFYFDLSESDYLAYQRAVANGKLPSTRESSLIAEVRLTDETEWKRQGILDFLDNTIDRGAGTIRARAVFANPDFFITPGQFGRLRLPGSERHEAILIPDGALVTDQSRKIVMLVKDDGTVEPRVVRPGPMVDGLRVIRDGLGPSDRIIINGLVRARPGGKVTPQPGKIEANAS
jgi:RND family efflux transporter MFP subunit